MEALKKLLGEELYKQVAEKLGDKKLLIQEKDGDWIPKHRFDEVNSKLKSLETEKKDLEGKLTSANEELKKLKEEKENKNKSTDELIQQLKDEIKQMKTELDEKEKDFALDKKRSKLREALMSKKANPKYVKFLEQEFDLEKLEFDEAGNIKDFEELVKPVIENNQEMFGEFKLKGEEPSGGLELSEEEKQYKELMSKDELTPVESARAMELAQKIKEKKNKE